MRYVDIMQGIHEFRRKERAADEERHRHKSRIYAISAVVIDAIIYGSFGTLLLAAGAASVVLLGWWGTPLVLVGLYLALSIWVPMVRGWASLWRFWAIQPGTSAYKRLPPRLLGSIAQDPELASLADSRGGLLLSCAECGKSKAMRIDQYIRRKYSNQPIKHSLQIYVFCRSDGKTRPECPCVVEILSSSDERIPPAPYRV